MIKYSSKVGYLEPVFDLLNQFSATMQALSSRTLLIRALILMASLSMSQADVLPADRRIDWEGSVGIPGGIPSRTVIFANVKNVPYGATGDGIADDWAAIQSAINNCPANQVVFIPAGRYRLNNGLRMKDSVTVRGAGMGKTILSFSMQSPYAVEFYSGDDIIKDMDILSGYSKGSTSLTLSDSTARVGTHLIMDQNNDPNVVNPFGTEGPGNNPSREYARAAGQISEVTAVNGNAVSIWPPMVTSFKAELQPKALLTIGGTSTMIRYAGLEDLSVYNTSGQIEKLIYFVRAAYCWIKNCETYRCLNMHMELVKSFRCEVRSCVFRETTTGNPSSSYGYCVTLGNKSSFNIIEDNTSTGNLNCVILEYGATGNVIAYNYSVNNLYYNKVWMIADYSIHALHPSYNLFEGNVGNMFMADFIHGSSSHNTVFRNYLRGKKEGTSQNHRAIVFDAWNRYGSGVGNVLGSTAWNSSDRYERDGTDYSSTEEATIWRFGYTSANADTRNADSQVSNTLWRHGNYDYVTKSTIWNPSNSDRSLPASLYRSSRPTWWDASLPWPPIGPDRNPMVGRIPAEQRFNGIPSGGTRPSAPRNLRIVSTQSN